MGDVGGEARLPGGGLVADIGGELGRSYRSWLFEPGLKELSTRIGGGGARALGVWSSVECMDGSCLMQRAQQRLKLQ